MRFLLALAVILGLSNPVCAQEATGIITIENSAQQDADIANRIREILSELGNYDDVSVIVNEGVVTLRGTTTSTIEALALEPLAARVEGVVTVRNNVTETTDIGDRLNPALTRFQSRWDQFVIFLPLALIAGLAFAVIVFFGMSIARWQRPWERLAPNSFMADIYRQLFRLVFVVLGIVVALDILNATALLSTILGAAGIIGLAIGFAVRDTVENFIASVMLSFRQPFRPNDTVEINGDRGKVIRLTSRATILLSFDGNHIRIPNATVFKSRIINYSQHAERRFLFTIMVDRESDLQATRQLVEETVQGLPFVLAEPAAQTWIEALHPAGVELVVTGWVDQNATSIVRAKGEALRQVKLAVRSAGVVMPDATQAITLTRHVDVGPPDAHESTQVEAVEASDDAALQRIVDAERDVTANEDLLSDSAANE
ncbi:mechanosensitive ion channel domain-containing protein [Yoonia sediminilitoris]|uniref:Small-conductance mechanosensitive channel n=1 Tax=Yoonia sediminilitoris TaxID=1286148 RepID=A0A2T6KKI0_9RHOB|nr:mechanosensitive ion channel domain-containing protein [Yoonia sediminilitoris]PUB16429.1 small-conductance mechanosensitive channel [Yoonia sediminilitoris]RCW96778.1 small-conductance mechanosensitive channel [Yoonia sediminilitoris]